jgi:hypothetical protein
MSACNNLLSRGSDVVCEKPKGHDGPHGMFHKVGHFSWSGTAEDACDKCKGRGTIPTPDLYAPRETQDETRGERP